MDMPLTEVKARLSEVVERVERGEAVRITKRGKPVVEMRPVEATGEEWLAKRKEAIRMVEALRAKLPRGTRTPEEIKADYREGLE